MKKDQLSDSGFSLISVASCCRINNVLFNSCSINVALAYLCIHTCVIVPWLSFFHKKKSKLCYSESVSAIIYILFVLCVCVCVRVPGSPT